MAEAVAGGQDDRTAKARIRDSAITTFAAHGVEGATVRLVAEGAGVSPALVIHHFGSKEALRRACDLHVATVIREQKREAIAEGAGLDPLAALRDVADGLPLLRYLARTLADGTEEVAALLDDLVADAEGYLAEGVEAGLLKPSAYPRQRAAVLLLWSLGALVLNEHVGRLLGADLTADLADPEALAAAGAYFGPVLELYGQGLMDEAYAARLRASLEQASAAGPGQRPR